MIITSIKQRFSLNEATAKFKGRVREMKRGPLLRVIEFYIPYRLFQVMLTNDGNTTQLYMAIDSATGQLDLYRFQAPPAKEERQSIESESVAPEVVNRERAFEILREKVAREVYLKGFFKVKELQVNGQYLETFHIPYYVGLYRRDERVTVEAINALSGRFEGAKVREIVVSWFQQSS